MSEIRMRQICLVAHDLDRIQQQCESVFGVEVCYRDPGVAKYGLHNFLIPFGDQFLETVSPQPGEHDTPGGRYLKRRGGDGGYMVIMQVPQGSYAGYQQRVADLGIRLVSEPGRNESGMGMQLHPKDVPGAIPELRWNVDEERPDGSWWPAGEDWQRAKHTEIVDGIRAAEIQTTDPAALAARWSEVLDEPVDGGEVPTIALRDAEIRFVPLRDGRPEGLGGLDIRVTDRARALANAEAAGCRTGEDLVTICGVRLRLVGAFAGLLAWAFLVPGVLLCQNLTPQEAVDLYGAAWAEPDEERRRDLLERAWAEDGVYTDPTAEVKGREALVAHIGGFLEQAQGGRIVITSQVDHHHGTRLRFSWAMQSASGQTLAEGIDYGELDEDGRLELIVGFFGPFPPLDSE